MMLDVVVWCSLRLLGAVEASCTEVLDSSKMIMSHMKQISPDVK